MELDIRTENGVKIIALTGVLDVTATGEFRNRFMEEVVDENKVIIDCLGLEYLDSGGLAALLNVYKQLSAQNTRMVFYGLSEGILRVIRFTKLDKVFDLADTLDEAFAKLD